MLVSICIPFQVHELEIYELNNQLFTLLVLTKAHGNKTHFAYVYKNVRIIVLLLVYNTQKDIHIMK